jgi:(p)ppGpp synthase/HD superfamily hydrolase
MDPPIVGKAAAFAKRAHESIGQVRKYGGEPYWTHLHAIAEIVSTVPHTPQMLAAAWLHDVLEDTVATPEEAASVRAWIRDELGADVLELVEALTDSPREAGNREARKALDRERLGAASAEAQTVKLADLIDNARSILANDPHFSVVYRREGRKLLEVLTKGDAGLRQVAAELLG